jgi:hypothetical protein
MCSMCRKWIRRSPLERRRMINSACQTGAYGWTTVWFFQIYDIHSLLSLIEGGREVDDVVFTRFCRLLWETAWLDCLTCQNTFVWIGWAYNGRRWKLSGCSFRWVHLHLLSSRNKKIKFWLGGEFLISTSLDVGGLEYSSEHCQTSSIAHQTITCLWGGKWLNRLISWKSIQLRMNS